MDTGWKSWILKPSIFLKLLIVVIIFSVLFYLLFLAGHVRRTLIFPMEGKKEQTSFEIRNLPRKWTTEQNVHLFIKELILGPVKLWNKQFIPAETSIQHTLVRKNTLYLDLSKEILIDDKTLPLAVQLQLIRKNVLLNFWNIRTVIITIDGELPL